MNLNSKDEGHSYPRMKAGLEPCADCHIEQRSIESEEKPSMLFPYILATNLEVKFPTLGFIA